MLIHHPFARTLTQLLLLAGALQNAFAKGILVKFLPNPAEDSIVRYDVYRSVDSASAGLSIGSILPAVADTLRYPDLTAGKGLAYYYSIRAVDAGGAESDFSDPAEVGAPLLALPDTLRPDGAGVTGFALAAAASPLPHAPAAFSLVDSSRFRLRFDAASRRLEFLSVRGSADTDAVVVRASCYGKFEDRDTLLVIAAALTTASRGLLPASGAPRLVRLVREGGGAWRLTGLPESAWAECLSARGETVFAGRLRGPEAMLPSSGAGYHTGYLRLSDRDGRPLGAWRLADPGPAR